MESHVGVLQIALVLLLLTIPSTKSFQPRRLLPSSHRARCFSAHADCYIVTESTSNHDNRFWIRPAKSTASKHTWNWCAHFVVSYNLCPWACASVESNTIRIYSVQDTTVNAKYLLEQISADLFFLDPNTAIFFVLFEYDTPLSDFEAFYEWFTDLEDDWDLDRVTLAPFHPEWTYGGGNDDPVDFEKQSPYPTVSLVLSSVIDKAGAAATEQIASNNEEILRRKSMDDWVEIYDKAVYGQNDDNVS